jgi:uncharacterized Zn-finger protein
MNTIATQATDVEEVSSLTVACDGGTPALGHPKVFLHIDPEDGEIVCPYCSRRFRLAAGADISGGH